MVASSNPDTPSVVPCRACGRTYAAEVLVCPLDGQVLPLEGRMLDGKFSLDRKIGDGGMASVWAATNVRVARTVAIKLMHTRFASDPELLARFRNEAAAAGKIDSDHICDVLDFGESPIGPYIVMELLDGCSLAELMAQRRVLDPGLAVWIARQALQGLAAAHRAGIVHRDLKPENIHLCRAIRGQWTIKLVDFGISKFSQDPNTRAGATLGTPHYMAPEQIQGAAKVDGRADLWSVGVILYEAVTGVQLFVRDNIGATLAALRTYDPPPLTQHLSNAPRGLAEVVAKCLVRAPDRRWASADALNEALAPFERMEQKTAEAAARAVTTERRKNAVPRALAHPIVPVQVAVQQPQVIRAVAVQPAAEVQAGRSASGLPQPGAKDRSPVASAASSNAAGRVGRLPMPGSQRTGGQVPVASKPVETARTGAAPTVKPIAVQQQGVQQRVVKPAAPVQQQVVKPAAVKQVAVQQAAKQAAPVKQVAAAKQVAAKQVASAAAASVQPSSAVKRGAAAPKRGVATTPSDRALLLGVLLALFGGIVVLVVVLAIK